MTENPIQHENSEQVGPDSLPDENLSRDTATIQKDLMARLLVANLRTEAVKAGMIDLDGLKLVDLASIRLDSDDKIVGGQALMAELRRNKPWLFGAVSSSSAAPVPASQPVRQKMAMEMSDDEYAAARKAILKYSL